MTESLAISAHLLCRHTSITAERKSIQQNDLRDKVMKTETAKNKPISRVIVDHYNGATFEAAVWDFNNMSRKTFKKRFNDEIQKPLQNALREHRTNPDAQLPYAFYVSMRGIIRELSIFYLDSLSRPLVQMSLNIREEFGQRQNGNKVALVNFVGVERIRQICMPLCNKGDVSISVSSIHFQELRDQFSTNPAFASPMTTVEQGCRNPGVFFPLLLIISILEMHPTKCPDTFMDAQIVKILSKEDLKRGTVVSSVDLVSKLPSSKKKFQYAISQDPELSPYLGDACAVCSNSGVFKLKQCSRCQVARYCCKEHQTQGWKVHKKHCKKLCALRRTHSYY